MGKNEQSGLKMFLDSRAKLRSIADEEEFFGWVVPDEDGRLAIRLDNPQRFIAGTRYEIKLSSAMGTTRFESIFEGHYKDAGYFSLPQLMRIDPPVTQARRKAPVSRARIVKGGSGEVRIVDVSTRGLGLVTAESFETGAFMTIQIESPNGPILIDASVVYSRFDQEQNQGFRTGIQFDRLGRIDEARWQQLLSA